MSSISYRANLSRVFMRQINLIESTGAICPTVCPQTEIEIFSTQNKQQLANMRRADETIEN